MATPPASMNNAVPNSEMCKGSFTLTFGSGIYVSGVVFTYFILLSIPVSRNHIVEFCNRPCIELDHDAF